LRVGRRSAQLAQPGHGRGQVFAHPLVLVAQRVQLVGQVFDKLFRGAVGVVVVLGELGRDLIAPLGRDEQDRAPASRPGRTARGSAG
jgi:hypothetical protein